MQQRYYWHDSSGEVVWERPLVKSEADAGTENDKGRDSSAHPRVDLHTAAPLSAEVVEVEGMCAAIGAQVKLLQKLAQLKHEAILTARMEDWKAGGMTRAFLLLKLRGGVHAGMIAFYEWLLTMLFILVPCSDENGNC